MQVHALEEYLRVPLFRRNGRHVELTSTGMLLRPKVEQALADLERAIDEARADRGSGPLRITTLAFFLAQWLLPRLPSFSARHPTIDVQIDALFASAPCEEGTPPQRGPATPIEITIEP